MPAEPDGSTACVRDARHAAAIADDGSRERGDDVEDVSPEGIFREPDKTNEGL